MRRKGAMKFETREVDGMAAWNDWRIKWTVINYFPFDFLYNDTFLKWIEKNNTPNYVEKMW